LVPEAITASQLAMRCSADTEVRPSHCFTCSFVAANAAGTASHTKAAALELAIMRRVALIMPPHQSGDALMRGAGIRLRMFLI
jgi:hypothetical protein